MCACNQSNQDCIQCAQMQLRGQIGPQRRDFGSQNPFIEIGRLEHFPSLFEYERAQKQAAQDEYAHRRVKELMERVRQPSRSGVGTPPNKSEETFLLELLSKEQLIEYIKFLKGPKA